MIDGRYGISGAQPAATVLQALRRAHAERAPLAMVSAEAAGPGCEGDSCAV